MTTVTAYPLDNRHDRAVAHHRAMAELMDPFTRRRILGLAGWRHATRCLELGAGHGSIAYWLADQVEPGGEVVACDLKPDHIPAHPRLVTVAHDLTADAELAPLVGAGFDLIHARLTLSHLSNRWVLLRRLVDLLAPGGTLLLEDWAARWSASLEEVVIAAPSPEAAQLYYRYHQAAGKVFTGAGTEPTWAPRVYVAMLEAGLEDVAAVIHGEYWRGGGSPGLPIARNAAQQMRPQLVAAGLTEPDLDQVLELMEDPGLLVHPHLLYSTSGRRPT